MNSMDSGVAALFHRALAMERMRKRLGGWIPLGLASVVVPGAPLAVLAEWAGRDEGYPRGFPWYVALRFAWFGIAILLGTLWITGIGVEWAFPAGALGWFVGLAVLNVAGSLTVLLPLLVMWPITAVVTLITRARERPSADV